MLNSLMLFISPALLSVALMVDVTQPLTPIDDVIRQLLNLGVGGVIAVVFFFQWQAEMKKRETAEKRERTLLLKLARIDLDDHDGVE